MESTSSRFLFSFVLASIAKTDIQVRQWMMIAYKPAWLEVGAAWVRGRCTRFKRGHGCSWTLHCKSPWQWASFGFERCFLDTGFSECLQLTSWAFAVTNCAERDCLRWERSSIGLWCSVFAVYTMSLFVFIEHFGPHCAGVIYKTTIVPSNTFFLVSYFRLNWLYYWNIIHIWFLPLL